MSEFISVCLGVRLRSEDIEVPAPKKKGYDLAAATSWPKEKYSTQYCTDDWVGTLPSLVLMLN